jgi:hypothetical protein
MLASIADIADNDTKWRMADGKCDPEVAMLTRAQVAVRATTKFIRFVAEVLALR